MAVLLSILDDGRLAIDNKAAECGMRPIGVGGRNWLFAGFETCGETLARATIVIETAKVNGLDPQAYLNAFSAASKITRPTGSRSTTTGVRIRRLACARQTKQSHWQLNLSRLRWVDAHLPKSR